MNTEKAIALAKEIFNDEPSRARGLRWWLFEHGTVVLSLDNGTETQALADMAKLAEALGPYEGQGSIYGDVNPMQLARHAKTWLVAYGFTGALVTFVDADDFGENRLPVDEYVQTPEGVVSAASAVGNLQAGLVGRTKRNRDARERKIIARHEMLA